MKTAILPAFVAFALIAGCGREAPEGDPEVGTEPADAPAEHAAAVSPAGAPQNPTIAALSVEDVERWRRGMQAEMQAVQEAADKLANAPDENAKLEALQAAAEMGTIDAGAAAAGLDRDRYRYVRNALSNAVAQLSPLEMEMDVSAMPENMVQQMRDAREASAAQIAAELPPELVAALREQAEELRKQDKLLVAERLKVAMAAR